MGLPSPVHAHQHQRNRHSVAASLIDDEYLSSIIQMKKENLMVQYSYMPNGRYTRTHTVRAFPSLPVERRLLRKHVCVHRKLEWNSRENRTKAEVHLNSVLIQLMLAASLSRYMSPQRFLLLLNRRHTRRTLKRLCRVSEKCK